MMIDITVADAVAVILWLAFIVVMFVLIFNDWDRSINELDKWEDEK
jgi:hypothetical protein